MLRTRTILPALAAVCFLATASFAADAPPPPPSGDMHGGPMSFLTPEEGMMFFAQMHKDTAGLTEDQRRAYMDKQFSAFKNMNDADKKNFADDLKAKWDSLPPDRKAQIKKDMDDMRAHHPGPGGPQ